MVNQANQQLAAEIEEAISYAADANTFDDGYDIYFKNHPKYEGCTIYTGIPLDEVEEYLLGEEDTVEVIHINYW